MAAISLLAPVSDSVNADYKGLESTFLSSQILSKSSRKRFDIMSLGAFVNNARRDLDCGRWYIFIPPTALGLKNTLLGKRSIAC